MTALMLAGGHVATLRSRPDGSTSVTVRHPDGRSRGYAICPDRVALGEHLMAANRQCAKPFPHPSPAWFGVEAGGRDTATYKPGSRYDDPCGNAPRPAYEATEWFDDRLFDDEAFRLWADEVAEPWSDEDLDAWEADHSITTLYVGGYRVA